MSSDGTGGTVFILLAAQVNGDYYGKVVNYVHANGTDLAGAQVTDDDDDCVVLLLDINFTNESQCYRNVYLNASADGGTEPYTYSWKFGDGITGSGQAVTHQYGSTGFFTVTLNVTDAEGYSGEIQRSIYVPEPLHADAGSDKYISKGKSVQIGGSPTASYGFSPYTYDWSPAARLDNSSASNPVASPLQNTKYTVNATDSKSCEATDNVTVWVSDISVTKTAVPAIGSAGADITFTLDVVNSGGVLLQSAFVSDLLPVGMSYVSSNPVGVNNGRYINWSDIGSLDAGENRSLEIVARIDGPVYGIETLTNRVDVEGKPVQGENVTNSTTVDVQAQEAKINVTKVADPTFGSKGTLVNFTMVVTNNASASLPHVYVRDVLPAGLAYNSSSGGISTGQNVYWSDIGPMAKGDNRTLWIKATITGSVYGKLTNVVSVEGQPEQGSNVTDIARADVSAIEAAINVSKKANPTYGSKGTLINFTLNVTNNADAPLPHVFVSDLLPAGLTYNSSSAGTNSGQYVRWSDIGPMTSGQKKTLWIKATIDGSKFGTLTNRVDVEGRPEYGSNVSDYATADVLAKEALIEVSKTSNLSYGSPCTNVSYTLTIRNSGQINLSNVFVSDTLPTGMSYVSSEGGANNGRYVNWSDIGSFAPDESRTLKMVAHIDGSAYGTLTNRVDVIGKPDHGGNVSDYATADVLAKEALIEVSKTSNLSYGSPCTNVSYTLTIRNSGQINLSNVFVSDTLPTGMSYVSSEGGVNNGRYVNWSDIGSFAPDESRTLKMVAHINGAAYGTLTNRVDVIGKPDHGGNVSDYATADVLAKEALIEVSKTSNLSYGSPCTNVSYTLTIRNSGQINLSNVFVSDTLPTGMSYVSSDGGVNNGRYVNWSDIGSLVPDQSKTIKMVAHIDGAAYGTLTNRVDVIGKPDHGGNVTAYATEDVEARRASVEVSKTSNLSYGSPCTNVSYTLTIRNSGQINLSNVFVSDTLPTGMSYVSSDGGVNNGRYVNWSDIGSLVPDQSKTIKMVAHIDGAAYGTLTNRVDVIGKPDHGGNVTAYATEDVEARRASVEVSKTSNLSYGSPCTNVSYTLTIRNSGQINLSNVFVSDTLPTGMSYVSSDGGVNNGRYVNWSDIGSLVPDQSKTIKMVAHIDGAAYGTLTNRVDVIGKPDHGGNVTAYATEDVEARRASVEVSKTSNLSYGSPCTNVSYTLTIRNSGQINLSNVFVSDTLPTGMSYVSSDGGVNNGRYVNWSDIGSLVPDQSKTIKMVAHIDGAAYGTLTNRVDVIGKPDHGGNVTAYATEDVEARRASVEVSKTSNLSYGSPCTNVSYTLTIRNSGQINLSNVFVSDTLPTGMSYVSSDGGVNNGRYVNWSDIGSLVPDQSKTIKMVAHIDGAAYGTLTNRVDVIGKPDHGGNVTAYATEDVEARRASVEVSKTSNLSYGSPCTNVSYTLTIRNSGQINLSNVFVSDTLPTGMSYVSSDGGVNNGRYVNWSDIGSLVPDQSKTIKMVAHIDGAAYGTLTNRVDVIGKPDHGGNVTAYATEDVEARRASVEVSKTSNLSYGSPCTNVSYTLTIRNSGQINLSNVFVSDTLPTGMSYVSSDGGVNNGRYVNWSDIGSLVPDQSKTIKMVAHIDGAAYGTLTNRVDVIGKPDHGGNVTAYATEDVEARRASVEVSKTSNLSYGSPCTNVSYTLTIRNSGQINLSNVFVSDTLPTGMSYVSSDGGVNNGRYVNWSDIGSLVPDQSKTIKMVAHIDGAAYGTLTNRVDVIGKPDHGGNVTAYATEDVEARRASVEVSKTSNLSYGSPCTNVSYTLTIRNSGQINLSNVFVSDTLPTGMSYVSSDGGVNNGRYVNWSDIGSLVPDQSKTIKMVAHIDGAAYGTLTNRVDVIGKPDHGGNVTAYATEDVEARRASVEVSKTSNLSYGSPCTNVSYTLTIRNSGQINLSNVFVSDTLPTGMSYVSSDGGVNNGRYVNWSDIGSLVPDQSKTIKMVAHIDGAAYGTLTNRVDVIGKPDHGGNVTAYATEDVEARRASVEVSKTSNLSYGSPCTNVSYTLTIRNSGQINLSNVFVSDTLPTGMSYVSSDGGVNNGRYVNWSDIGSLVPDQSKTIKMVAHIDGAAYGTLTNRVDVIGKPDHGGNVTAYATEDVEARRASVEVSKTSNLSYGSPCTNVSYTLTIRNSGQINLSNVFVSDTLPTGMSYVSSDGGVNNGRYVNWSDIGSLVPDQSKTIKMVAHIDGAAYGTLTNRVDVIGKPDHGGNVTAYATEDVEARRASVEVSKTSNLSYGSPCTNVSYTLTIRNSGQINLSNVFVSDTLPTGMSYVSSDGGVNNGRYVNWSDIGSLVPDQSKTIKMVAHIDGAAYGTLTNRVDVIGKPDHGGNVTAYATEDVEARRASVEVSKTSNLSYGSPCTNVSYTLTIRNSGQINLSNVFVSDTLPTGMSYVSSDGGVNNGRYVNWSDIGSLVPDQSKTIKMVAHIDGAAYGTLTNRVDVIGKPDHGGNVTAYATEDVEARRASVEVSKTSNLSYGSPCTNVSYTLTIRNSGQINLSNVFVSDTLPTGMSYVSSDGGVNNGQHVNWADIGRMVPGETKTRQIVAHIDGPVSGLATLTNRVDVEGKPDHGKNVTNNTTTVIQAQEAKIRVTKLANVTYGAPSTNVEFEMVVTNTGDTNLTHVFVTDLLPVGLNYVSSEGGVNNGRYVNWSDIGSLQCGDHSDELIFARIDGTVYGELTNRVDVEGKPEHGGNVTDNATAAVNAERSGISVTKIAEPDSGTKGATIKFSMTATNNETIKLVSVSGVDTLPLGLKFVNATPAESRTIAQPDGRTLIEWDDLGELNSSESHDITVYATIDGTSPEKVLTNKIDVTGTPEYGGDRYASATADVRMLNASINVTQSPDPDEGIPGTKIRFTIVVTNTGESDLLITELHDLVPDGLMYLSDDHNGTYVDPNQVFWRGLGILRSGESITILMDTEIVGTIMGELDNPVDVIAVPIDGGDPVMDDCKGIVNAKPVPYEVTKTSDKSSYKPGEEITYTITVCNRMKYIEMTDVLVKDVFKDLVEIVAYYPEQQADGTWYFDAIPGTGVDGNNPDSCKVITIIARVPKDNRTFDLEQSVSGTGFVNVHNDLSTSISPYEIENCVYVTAKVATETWNRSTCTSVTVEDKGTELDTREHGSGEYASEEKAKLIWENKSLRSYKNVSADYSPTTFELPGSRGINYSSKWTEESRAKNYITGTTMHESYRYADSVDRNTYVNMDENGSEMKIDASFVGKGSISFYKKSSADDGPKIKPVFESQQDYSGAFDINEGFEEYGKNIDLNRDASGEGFVSSDQRVRDSQRSYEYGTGSYSSEEVTDSFTNYIAKDINVTHRPVSYNYSPTIQANQNLLWSEGMISKTGTMRGGEIIAANNSAGGELEEECVTNGEGTAPATVISEKYSSLDYMKKETVALGLNEMKTNATFQGVADYKSQSVGTNGSTMVDDEESYVGQYDVSRHVLITGASKYDYPHIVVSKEGVMKNELVNAVNSTVVDYTITVTNDGNRALAPVYVQDLFPPGTEYVSSSVKPSSLSETDANWTLLHLGIGNSLTIELRLNITESAPGNVINRVEAVGFTGDTTVSSSNSSSLVFDWIPCCPSSIGMEKVAEIDSLDPSVVRYAVTLKNYANSIMAVQVSDEIPGGMSLLQSSIEPYSSDDVRIVWNIADLKPAETKVIEYRMKASRNGAYTNKVHVVADSVSGSGSYTADASAFIEVTGTGSAPYTTKYDGWQPPDWGLNTSDEGITI